jgi:hypothetical protein
MYRYSKSSNQSTFRSDSPLSNEEIAQYAPSILAIEPHESRGKRYSFIPTIQVLDGLRDSGFQPFEVRQTRCRDLGKRDHTKHMIRLRHADSISRQEVPEIVLLNSHDGSSSYQIMAGVFRFICSNGLIAGDVCNDVRIRHSGNVVDDVIEGSFEVLQNLEQVESRIENYKQITLSDPEKELLAETAAEIKWGRDEETGNIQAPISSFNQIIRPNRWDDRKNDLWTVANVVQENLVRGGLSGRSANGRRTRTREVNGVNENVRLNKALWSLTDRFAQLKLAA